MLTKSSAINFRDIHSSRSSKGPTTKRESLEISRLLPYKADLHWPILLRFLQSLRLPTFVCSDLESPYLLQARRDNEESDEILIQDERALTHTSLSSPRVSSNVRVDRRSSTYVTPSERWTISRSLDITSYFQLDHTAMQRRSIRYSLTSM